MIERITSVARIVLLGLLRRKQLYVMLILMAAIISVLLSINIFGLGSMSSYVRDIGLTLTWLISWIIAVQLSARELPQEESRGTIFSLVAKPLTRIEILVGKWLGAWIAAVFCAFLCYLMLLSLLLLRNLHTDYIALLQAVILHSFFLAILCSITIAFSTRMNADAAATLGFVLTGLAALGVPRLPHLAVLDSGFRQYALLFIYHLAPHMEFFDMRRRLVHDWGAAPWGAVLIAVTYALFYSSAWLAAGWLAYRHKRFSRGLMAVE